MLSIVEVSSPCAWDDLDREPSMLSTAKVSSPSVWGELGGKPAKPLQRSSQIYDPKQL